MDAKNLVEPGFGPDSESKQPNQQQSEQTKQPKSYSFTNNIPKCLNCSNSNESVPNDPDKTESNYFNFDCQDCVQLLDREDITINQLLAIARQWIPSVQQNMNFLIELILKKGAHPDDRDELTDMTLLHFACKSGCIGMGDQEKSLKIVKNLIEINGANPNLICKWNDMSPLHLATYYDNATVLGYLITVVNPSLIDYPCKLLDSKTPLHIAATNLCLKSIRILLSGGANILLKDAQMRTPLDCVPIIDDNHHQNHQESIYDLDQKQDLSLEISTLLEEATLLISGESNLQDLECLKTAKVVLSALGLEIGDRILLGNSKIGTLRYCGPTQFATGIWTGIELLEPIGKNDGSINGIRYFQCKPNFGIFAPINRITKLDSYEDYLDDLDSKMSMIMKNGIHDSKQHHQQSNQQQKSQSKSNSNINLVYNTLNNIHSKIDTGLSTSMITSSPGIGSSGSSPYGLVNSEDIILGTKVYLQDKKTGIVRFIGTTEFAQGIWYGLELTRPVGKNDGSINGIRYFQCEDRYGIFVQFSRIARILKSSRNQQNTIKNKINSPSMKRIMSPLSTNNYSESEDSDLSMMSISGTSSLDLIQFGTSNGVGGPGGNGSNRYSSLKRNVGGGGGKVASIRRSMSLINNNSSASRSSRIISTSTSTINNNRSSSLSTTSSSWLKIGTNVLVNGQIGSIRYIGPVHFTNGIFIGIELRQPNGKNDGSIDGKRYFQCKPQYGLLVRPKKVSIRGINASKLLPPDDDQEEEHQNQENVKNLKPAQPSSPKSSSTPTSPLQCK